MDKQGALGKTQTQKGSMQRVEAGTRNVEGIQRHCLSIQESIRKAELQIELNLAKDVKENRKGFYTYFCDKRKTG